MTKWLLTCRALFDQLTEAAEVLLDHGETNVYSWTRQQAQQQAQQAKHQLKPPVAKRAKHEVHTLAQVFHTVRHHTWIWLHLCHPVAYVKRYALAHAS